MSRFEMFGKHDVFEKKHADALKQKSDSPRMIIFTNVFFYDFDDNNGRREMTHFLIWSMAVTTTTC